MFFFREFPVSPVLFILIVITHFFFIFYFSGLFSLVFFLVFFFFTFINSNHYTYWQFFSHSYPELKCRQRNSIWSRSFHSPKDATKTATDNHY